MCDKVKYISDTILMHTRYQRGQQQRQAHQQHNHNIFYCIRKRINLEKTVNIYISGTVNAKFATILTAKVILVGN